MKISWGTFNGSKRNLQANYYSCPTPLRALAALLINLAALGASIISLRRCLKKRGK